MRRNSIHITTFVILTGILSVTAQCCLYYFTPYYPVIYGLSILVTLFFSHILIEKFHGYDTGFSYLLLNSFTWFVISLLSYTGKGSFLPFHWDLLFFIVLNWGIPTLYYMIRRLADYGERYPNFNAFFRNSSVVCLTLYTALLAIFLYFGNKDETAFTVNMVPFLTIASVIENFIDKTLSLKEMILYFVKYTLYFAPYGFYIILLLRYKGRIFRGAALFLLPLLWEALQLLLQRGQVDVDGILLGWFGGLLGGFLYHLTNCIFRHFTDRDFLSRSSRGFYSGRNLYY